MLQEQHVSSRLAWCKSVMFLFRVEMPKELRDITMTVCTSFLHWNEWNRAKVVSFDHMTPPEAWCLITKPSTQLFESPARTGCKKMTKHSSSDILHHVKFAPRISQSSKSLPTLKISVTFVTFLAGSSCKMRQKSGPISGAEMQMHTIQSWVFQGHYSLYILCFNGFMLVTDLTCECGPF